MLEQKHQENQKQFQSTIDKIDKLGDKISLPLNKIAEAMNELTPTNTILQFLAVLNAMWLLTSFSWISTGRPFIISISFCVLFIESTLHWFAMQGHIMIAFKEVMIPKIRMLALGLDLFVILISMCFYFCRSKPTDIKYDMNINFPNNYTNSMDSRHIPNPKLENINTTSINRHLRSCHDNATLTPNHKSTSDIIQKDECIENLFNTFSNLQKRTEQKLPLHVPEHKTTYSNSQENSSNVTRTSESIPQIESRALARKEEAEDAYLLNELITAKSNLINLLEYVDNIEQERIRSPKRRLVEDSESEEEMEEGRAGKKIRLSS